MASAANILDYGTQPRHARLQKFGVAIHQAMSRTASAACIVLLSLLLLWPCSYFREYAVGYAPESKSQPNYWLGLNAGRFEWHEYQSGDMPEGFHVECRRHTFAESWTRWSYGQKERESDQFWSWEFAGLTYFVPVPPHRPMYPRRVITVPLSLCAAAVAILPAVSILSRWRKRATHRAANLCLQCARDPRAPRPDPRPECGTVPAKVE